MKEMKNTEGFTERDWEELASSLSGENSNQQTDLIKQFMSEDSEDAGKQWEALRDMNDDREINVDAAWNKVQARLKETGTFTSKTTRNVVFMRSAFMKIAAVALILLGLGTAGLYINNTGAFSKKILVATGNDEKNVRLDLPDGSTIFLNRNTELTCRAKFGKSSRNVKLAGEAYFEIASDPERPFIVDAGKAKVKVTGTSFNVITNNTVQAVEVFVNTGQVVLSDNAGDKNLVLDPGYVGTLDSKLSEKKLNDDPNYLSWKTGLLKYDNQKLEVVFKDLKRVYNKDIIPGNPEILNDRWSTTNTLDNEPLETIIQLICRSFNLSYSKDGNVYHLTKK
jgi:ferric-dicitrate binding protein FerR (iron transport regulator)